MGFSGLIGQEKDSVGQSAAAVRYDTVLIQFWYGETRTSPA